MPAKGTKKYLLVFNDGTIITDVYAKDRGEAWKKIAVRFSHKSEGPPDWVGLKPSTILRYLKEDYEIVDEGEYEDVYKFW